jgi:hypothetical protein
VACRSVATATRLGVGGGPSATDLAVLITTQTDGTETGEGIPLACITRTISNGGSHSTLLHRDLPHGCPHLLDIPILAWACRRRPLPRLYTTTATLVATTGHPTTAIHTQGRRKMGIGGKAVHMMAAVAQTEDIKVVAGTNLAHPSGSVLPSCSDLSRCALSVVDPGSRMSAHGGRCNLLGY